MDNKKTLKVSFVNQYLVKQGSLAISHQGRTRRPLGFTRDIETERVSVHDNRELIRFAPREEKVKKVIERV
jgi:hypothetical protein